MSLNGYINVNDQKVGYWEAVRKEPVMSRYHRYECVLFYRNQEGRPLHAEFNLVHHESMGAVSLANQVLSNGYRRLKAYAPGQDKEFPL